MLIAETDDKGRVAWLWRGIDGKCAKPVKDAASCLREIDDSAIFGASKTAVTTWLKQQADQPT